KHNADLFEAGQVDEFRIRPSKFSPSKVHKIRIGHDNSGLASGWHLSKVELLNPKRSLRYMFDANRWLSEDEGDKKCELVLLARDETRSNSKNSSSSSSAKSKEEQKKKLQVEVIHDDDTIDSEADLPLFSASSKASS